MNADRYRVVVPGDAKVSGWNLGKFDKADTAYNVAHEQLSDTPQQHWFIWDCLENCSIYDSWRGWFNSVSWKSVA